MMECAGSIDLDGFWQATNVLRGQAVVEGNLICFHSSLDFCFSLVCANKDFVNLAAEQTFKKLQALI